MSSTPSLECPNPICRAPITYSAVACDRCGTFIGFPNYRAAEAERPELDARYTAAQIDANNRLVTKLLNKLQSLAENSRPVICMSFAACDDILRPGKYRNYHQRVDSGERGPADATLHADRSMVGERLFPNYKHHIQYAALSPDGRGLVNYGPIAVQWEVVPNYLRGRISLLEENSFTFYDQYELGRRGATLPLGYRAIWDDRSKLAVAKLASQLTAATAEDALATILLNTGATRRDDAFLEVFIYAENGLDTREVDLVTVQRAPATRDENYRLELIKEVCTSRSIRLVE